MDKTADAAARERALAPEQSFIVQAPAGSGKTELLTQRYLRLLATVDSPEQIVAITFTRKAAGEMRARVLKAIASADHEAPPEPHRAQTRRLARAVAARDAERGWQLADYPARLRIDTIDAFAGSLTHRLPLTAGLGVTPRIAEHAEDLYVEAARRALAELEGGDAFGDAIAALLAHLDNDVQKLEGLLVTMLTKRDQWLRLVHAGGDREALQAALAREVTDQLDLLCSSIPSDLEAELAELTGKAIANRDGVPWQGTGLPGNEPADAARWRTVATIWQKKDGGWLAKLTKKQGFPTDRKSLKQQATSLLDKLTDEPAFAARLAAVKHLPPTDYDDAQWRLLQALIDVLKLAAAQLQLVFGERGSVDFIEIALRALRALGEPQAPTDLALAMDYRLQHILVDEFQDTSWSQYALLERLTAGWTPGDGRTLFLVGDPMQSIYRFREAEVGLYLRARRDGIGDIALEPLSLGVNFRSTAAVVGWINRTFASLFPPAEDIASGAVPYAGAIAGDDDESGGVEVVTRFDADGHDEAERIVKLVESRRRAAPDESIGILARGKRHVAKTITALRRAGFKAQAVELEKLADRPVVRDVAMLARAIAHPADRTAWLAILRAPWCGLTLADLAALAENDKRNVWELLNDSERLQTLSGDGQARARRTIEALAPAVAEWRRQPLRRLVEHTWLSLGGPGCVDAPADLDDADACLAVLEEMDDAGDMLDPDTLDERLAHLHAQPAPGADEGLQVMTIHKAKGLEFDSVILPGLERVPNSDDRQLLLWLERPRTQTAPDFLLAPIAGADSGEEPLYESLKILRKQQDEFEELRLLYVAATRARKRLYIFGGVKTREDEAGRRPVKPNKRSLLAMLWPRIAGDFEKACEEAPPVEERNEDEAIPRRVRRLERGWQTPSPRRIEWRGEGAPDVAATAPVEFSWAGETARQIGVLVHMLLERVSRDGPDQWSTTRAEKLASLLDERLRWQGIPAGEVAAARNRIIAAVTTTLADRRGQWLLKAHDRAVSEYALTGIVAGRVVNGVIDRTFVDDNGVRWIVDYKTGRHEGGDLDAFLARERERYREQLETYARLLRAREERSQRVGLYFPLLGGWIEWEPGESPALAPSPSGKE